MRVVSLTASNTEILDCLGLSDWLVGVDDHSDWPREVVDRVPRVGPDLGIDVDAVAALAPDLVLASLTVPGHEAVLQALEERGLPFIAPEPTCLDHVGRDIRAIGAALGRASVGERAAERFEAALEAETVEPGEVGVLVEWWPRPVYAPGRHSWVTELLTRAGGRNPFGRVEAKSLVVDAMAAREAGVDAIVISWCGVPERKYRPEIVLRRDGWADLPAVRAQQVHPITEAWMGRPGPRLLEGLVALKRVVAAVATQ